MNDLLYYVRVLAETECHCGETKRRGLAFCNKCYFSLPNQIRIDLYQKLGDGFEQAYEDAVDYLSD